MNIGGSKESKNNFRKRRDDRQGIFRVQRSDKDTPSRFQPQKIFVEGIPGLASIEEMEEELTGLFGLWGNVIDVKVLRNGRLKRRRESLRLRHVRRGRVSPRSYRVDTRLPRDTRAVISFQWKEPWKKWSWDGFRQRVRMEWRRRRCSWVVCPIGPPKVD